MRSEVLRVLHYSAVKRTKVQRARSTYSGAIFATLISAFGPVVGVLVWFSLSHVSLPVDAPPTAQLVPAQDVEIDDPSSITAALAWSEGAEVYYFGPTGTVTESWLDRGYRVGVGSEIFSLGDVRVRAYGGPRPLTAIVDRSSSDEEKAAVVELLLAVGCLEQEGLEWTGRAMSAALKCYSEQNGLSPTYGDFDPAFAVWVPPAGTLVGETSVKVGGPSPSAGESIYTSQPQLVSVTAVGVDAPENFTLTVGAYETPLRPDSTVSTEALVDVAAEVEVLAGEVEAYIAPLHPQSALSVPPAAVLTDDTGGTCVTVVADGGDMERVDAEVVGGVPGVTYVSANIDPGTIVLANPTDVGVSPKCEDMPSR